MHAQWIWAESWKNDGIISLITIIALIKQGIKSVTDNQAKKSIKINRRWVDGNSYQASKA